MGHQPDRSDLGGHLNRIGRKLGAGAQQLGHARLLQLLLGRPQALGECLDATHEAVGLGLEQAGELRHHVALTGEVAEALDAGERLDAAVAGADAGLPGHHDGADLGGVGDVGAAAELARPRPADLDDPHLGVVVGLAEECDRAPLPGLLERHVVPRDRQVGAQRLLGHQLDVAHLLGAECARPAEVEAEVAGTVVGAGLQRGGAQHLAERGVHDVGAGVGLARTRTPLGVDPRVQRPRRVELAVDDAHLVDDQALDRTLDVEHLELTALEVDGAGVGHLAAGLGIERGAVEHQLTDLARRQGAYVDALAQHGERSRLRLQGLVGQPLGRAELVEDPAVDTGVAVRALLGARVGLGPLALLGHEAAKALLVDLQALLGGHLKGQVDREAEGVVQGEGTLAGERRAARRLHVGGRDVEDLGAGLERLAEGVLLGERDLRDARPVGDEVGVGLPHPVARQRHQLGQDPAVTAEQSHGADRTPQQPAQDVAATVVAGGDAVADEHHRGADVVGHHAEAHVVLRVVAVALAGQLLGLRDDGVDDVDLVHVVLALQQQRDAVKPHAGVDVLLRQRAGDVEVLLGPDRRELVLHEDEVPDLQQPVLEIEWHIGAEGGDVEVGTPLGSAVVEDLRARATRPGHAHRPVVLLVAELDDALAGQAGGLHPVADGLVVAHQDGGVETRRVEPVATVGDRLGEEVPRQLDRALLEVVTEGEVAAHLEEGAVASGLAHVLDVGGAHALLDARSPVVGRRLLAQEVGLERHHARRHEEQVGVVGEQRGGGHHGVSGGLEVREEAAADLGGVHQWWSFDSSVVRVGAGASSGIPWGTRPSLSRNSVSASTRPSWTSSANSRAPTCQPRTRSRTPSAVSESATRRARAAA